MRNKNKILNIETEKDSKGHS